MAVVNSLRSKLANKKVEGVFWLVVESLGGVWAFFTSKNIMYVSVQLMIGKMKTQVFVNLMYKCVLCKYIYA